jgi:hypothetical protein
MSEQTPSGEERQVVLLGGASIDGAPIPYVIVLAAVVVALSFFPMSVILITGGSFPMSQGILGLIGWVLGPVAGAVTSGIGALISIFLAPQTAGPIPAMRILGSVVASFAAGSMVVGNTRKRWWLIVWLIGLISLIIYLGRAIFSNGVGLWPAFAASFVDWSALIIYLLPTRVLIARWINNKNMGLVILGLALGTWTVYGLSHVTLTAIYYSLYNWPEVQFYPLIPTIPFENVLRAGIAVVIGSGVIAGLRAIGLVKPKHAIY